MKRATQRKLMIGTAMALAAAGLWFWLGRGTTVRYRTVAVERGALASSISATGNSNAVVTVQVGSQVSGNIQALYANFNTKVTKGQLVARIDPAMFEARASQARAALESAEAAVVNANASVSRADADISAAQADLDTAKANIAKDNASLLDARTKYDRRLELFRAGLISIEDRDTAKATYDGALATVEASKSGLKASEGKVAAARANRAVAVTQLTQAKAQVKQAAANLQQAELDLEHTFIRAPVDGTVIARQMDVGQTVAASFQAPTIFEIAQDLTNMQVDTNVDEADIGRVRLGQPANFTVDAYPGQDFHGEVKEIRRAPINVQNVITYDVVIGVQNTGLKLFPGMTANVKILTDRRDQALKIPNAALRFRPPISGDPPTTVHAATASRPDGMQSIWVEDAHGEPTAVRVKLGITDGAYSEVVAGDLKAGDRVIVAADGVASNGNRGPVSARAGGGRRGPGF